MDDREGLPWKCSTGHFQRLTGALKADVCHHGTITVTQPIDKAAENSVGPDPLLSWL